MVLSSTDGADAESQVEIAPGVFWVVAGTGVSAPAVVEANAQRARRPLRYTWPAQAGAFGALAVWLVLSLAGVLDGVLVAGIMDAPRVAWLVAGIALAVAMMATIEPHAGSECGAYAAQCTPSRNTITGRFRQ